MQGNLSICVIAKNEEQNLRQCLQGIAPLQCEIILVDTGSTDATVEIAAHYTRHIFSFPWTGDFSDARNFAARQASHDWILAVDCDEFLAAADLVRLWATMEEHPDLVGMITLLNPYDTDGTGQVVRERIARLYNRTLFSYRGRIREQIRPRAKEEPLRYFEIPLTFYHAGRLAQDTRRDKLLAENYYANTLSQFDPEKPLTASMTASI